MKQYLVDKFILKSFLENSIKGNNKEAIIEMLFSELDIESLNHMITLAMSAQEYKPFYKNEIVIVPVVPHHDGEYCEMTLRDLNILPSPGHVYGIIEDNHSWRSDFNPYSAKFRLSLFYNDNDKNPTLKEYSVESRFFIRPDESTDCSLLFELFNKLKNG